MQKNIDEIFSKIDNEVTDLHFRWNMYRDVFAGGRDQIELLNKCGSNFFYYVNFLMLDHISLAFSKLTDPNQQGGKIKYENMSLKQFHVVFSDSGENDLVKLLNEQFEVLIESCKRFRELRNKRIAHVDFNHALNLEETPLPGISRAYVEAALCNLRDYMNIINRYRKNSTTLYELTEGPLQSSGKQLISALQRSIQNA